MISKAKARQALTEIIVAEDRIRSPAGRKARYHKPRNVVFVAPSPVIDWLDEVAHELRTSRGEVLLYLIDMGARAAKQIDSAEWLAVVAASRHTGDDGASADDATSGRAKHLTDIDRLD